MRIDMVKSKGRMKRSPSSIVEEDEKFEEVNFSGLSLDSVPISSNKLNFTIISKLDLSNNNIQILPESLTARLLNLVMLDIHSNLLKTLPNSIGCLSKLKVLNVSGNSIQVLPTTIENCRSLEELNANFNKLTKLPDTIGFELVNIKKLSVNSNKLAFLPYSLSHMTTLRVLDARLNYLRALPEDLENLINLEILNVSQNFQFLEVLPYSVGLLLSLKELDISYNKITTLPDSIIYLKNLQKLSVDGNPLTSPPIEVVEKGLKSVKEYLSERISGKTKPKSMKRSLIGKLVKCGTFDASMLSRDGYSSMPDYRTINGRDSPSYFSMLSPLRLFSPRRSSGSS